MPYRIMLVDDDREFREEFRACFDDYEIVEASSGEAALGELRKPNEIDLVILDVMMPGLKGTEVLREIKKTAPDLGIIILTGHGSKDVAVESLRGRADDFFEKPMPAERMREVISHLLRARDGGGPAADGDVEAKIERVKRFAERNYHKKVCLKDAAAAVCLSPKYLSRLFRQTARVSFSEYRLGIKMRKARELLKTGGCNVNQVADRLGYENAESFIRQFRKITGLTPAAYRGRRRARKGRGPAKKRSR